MKKSALLIGALGVIAFTFNLKAQKNTEANTLLGNETSINTENMGFFVAPVFGISAMDGSTVSLFNLRGGLVVRDRFSIGAYFNTSLNEIYPESETVPGVYMDYWTVGGFAEYTLFSKKLIHLTLPLYLGYGEVQMDNDSGDAGLGEANFFQVEPAALLEVNLHKYVRLNLGAGYRIVGQMEYRNFNHQDISGLTGYAGFRIGLFR